MTTFLIGFLIYTLVSFLAALGIAKAFFQPSLSAKEKCMPTHFMKVKVRHLKYLIRA